MQNTMLRMSLLATGAMLAVIAMATRVATTNAAATASMVSMMVTMMVTPTAAIAATAATMVLILSTVSTNTMGGGANNWRR